MQATASSLPANPSRVAPRSMAVGAFIAAVAVAAFFASEVVALGIASVWSVAGMLDLAPGVTTPAMIVVLVIACGIAVWLYRRVFRAERALEAELGAANLNGPLAADDDGAR